MNGTWTIRINQLDNLVHAAKISLYALRYTNILSLFTTKSVKQIASAENLSLTFFTWFGKDPTE
jgi:hypothetical protein